MTPCTAPASTTAARYLLRLRPLHVAGRERMFGCDAAGHVDLDALDRRTQFEYLYVRALVGRDFVAPRVVAVDRQTP